MAACVRPGRACVYRSYASQSHAESGASDARPGRAVCAFAFINAHQCSLSPHARLVSVPPLPLCITGSQVSLCIIFFSLITATPHLRPCTQSVRTSVCSHPFRAALTRSHMRGHETSPQVARFMASHARTTSPLCTSHLTPGLHKTPRNEHPMCSFRGFTCFTSVSPLCALLHSHPHLVRTRSHETSSLLVSWHRVHARAKTDGMRTPAALAHPSRAELA